MKTTKNDFNMNRVSAIAWWNNDLHHSEKEDVSQEFYGRAHHTLTGREIEHIWKTTQKSRK